MIILYYFNSDYYVIPWC